MATISLSHVEDADQVILTATLTEGMTPLVAKTLYFDITGANTAQGSAVTNASGEAEFVYLLTAEGTDHIRIRWGSSDGLNLLSIDTSTDQIYQHDGFSDDILDAFSTPGSTPSHVAFDGDNVLSADGSVVYQHDGFSDDILDSFDAGFTILGIAWDGTNLLLADGFTVKKYAGFSSTVTSTVTLTGLTSIRGIGWDGTNLLIANTIALAADEVRRYVGFSSSLDQTLTMPYAHAIFGVSWDGENLVTGAEETSGSGPDHIYLHAGYSATIDTEIASPSSQIRGVGWAVALVFEDDIDVEPQVEEGWGILI